MWKEILTPRHHPERMPHYLFTVAAQENELVLEERNLQTSKNKSVKIGTRNSRFQDDLGVQSAISVTTILDVDAFASLCMVYVEPHDHFAFMCAGDCIQIPLRMN